jgi:hypothetical protein
MWRIYRVIESNGFVSKRILLQCHFLMASLYGVSAIKDGRVIADLFKILTEHQRDLNSGGGI